MEDQPMDAEDDYSSEQPDTDMIINETDGLPNVHPNLDNLEREVTKQKDCDVDGDTGARTIDELIHDDDLPTSLIVTNVDSSVFQNDEAKVGQPVELESGFHYLLTLLMKEPERGIHIIQKKLAKIYF